MMLKNRNVAVIFGYNHFYAKTKIYMYHLKNKSIIDFKLISTFKECTFIVKTFMDRKPIILYIYLQIKRLYLFLDVFGYFFSVHYNRQQTVNKSFDCILLKSF